MADANKVTVDVTTGVGTLSFPHVFESTKSKKDNGEDSYDIQIIIPKEQRDDLRALLSAIKTVGEAKWGVDRWKKVRQPLRNGDKEADEMTEDGSTKGEKYPERIGAYFLNARSSQPVGVFDRKRVPITDPGALYGGCKGRISVTFYPYSSNGNTGIGCALNGVQKIADGDPIGGGGKPSVESMFDMLEDDDLDLEDEVEDELEDETPAPAKKAAAKKAPAKKAAAKKTPAKKVEVIEEDELDIEEGEEDLYDDLDDLDDPEE